MDAAGVGGGYFGSGMRGLDKFWVIRERGRFKRDNTKDTGQGQARKKDCRGVVARPVWRFGGILIWDTSGDLGWAIG